MTLDRLDDLDRLDRLVEGVCARASELRGDVRSVVTATVDRLAPLATAVERDHLINRSVARLDGLDVLEEFLRDPDVDEVMVNGGRQVWIERLGVVQHVGELATGAIDTVLERILAPLGKRLDRTNPIVDARLPDGGRLCAVVAPVAIDGTTVSIRRHRTREIPVAEFASPSVTRLLARLVDVRANMIVTGATSSGKTTLLAAMLASVPTGERLVVIEDTAELVLTARHVVRLEARVANVDGVTAIDTHDLVRTALRLRPDRLVVGEFRGGEVLAVVQALNTGHDGSLSTCHANSALDGIRRMETLAMQAAPSWPLAAIRLHVSRSIDAVVHLERLPAGGRRIVEIVEIEVTDDEPRGRLLADANGVVAEPERSRK